MFEHFSEDEKRAFSEMEHSILKFSKGEDIRERIKEYLIILLIGRLDHMNAAIMRISKLMHA